ncbi:MAG: T9SS type A sorting domain-containing protein [Bacteroidetes bacterium]|nr:T9SS type A sorting domain-containing protein [Bacteroidota bacterium]
MPRTITLCGALAIVLVLILVYQIRLQRLETGLRTRGSCVNVCNSNGLLLFYANTRAATVGKTTLVYNQNHQLMDNGINILGSGWYHELVIVPSPLDSNLYYLFCVGVTSNYGLEYSLIDMSQNGGLGKVILKNVQKLGSEQVDCLAAVKHGNGRDWWVVGRSTTILQNGQGNNEFWTLLVTPSGVGFPTFQNIGSVNETNLAKIIFSPSGDTLLFSNAGDLLEYYNFDRCTGLLSNTVTIRPQATVYSEWQWGVEFSANGRFIYASTSKDTTHLFQYDLWSANPLATRQMLWESIFQPYTGGDLKRGPDGKIYFTNCWDDGTFFPYPYPDTAYYLQNTYLSVINSPDSLGVACDFQPFSFYLGGKRTYWGLPNNPDYDLGPLVGSPCDTLSVNLTPGPSPVGEGSLFLTYISAWEKLFINASGLRGKQLTATIYDATGKEKLARGKPPGGGLGVFGGHFTLDVDCTGWPSGLYVVHLQTEKEVLSKKFVKE